MTATLTTRAMTTRTMTISAIHAAYRSGELTPQQLLTECLAHAKADTHLAWISVLSDAQLAAYLKGLEGHSPDDMPLFGIPFAVKDNIDLLDLPTTAACKEYAYQPKEHAFVVAQLIAAGAIPLGKTNLDQFATGLNGTRSPYGACRNSVHPEYPSGCSSAGSSLAVALGVTLVSLRGSNVDLLHLLFGSILAVDSDSALFVSGVASLTLICIALFYRGLVTEAFDTAWLQVNARGVPGLLHGLFLALLVLNLVAGFQVLGTLMAVGLMMLPAVAARCWVRTLPGLLLMAGISGIFCAWLGLSLSWAMSLPAGPSIVLTASALFFISILLGTRSRLAGSLRAYF